jgi:hypothetical protein
LSTTSAAKVVPELKLVVMQKAMKAAIKAFEKKFIADLIVWILPFNP